MVQGHAPGSEIGPSTPPDVEMLAVTARAVTTPSAAAPTVLAMLEDALNEIDSLRRQVRGMIYGDPDGAPTAQGNDQPVAQSNVRECAMEMRSTLGGLHDEVAELMGVVHVQIGRL